MFHDLGPWPSCHTTAVCELVGLVSPRAGGCLQPWSSHGQAARMVVEMVSTICRIPEVWRYGCWEVTSTLHGKLSVERKETWEKAEARRRCALLACFKFLAISFYYSEWWKEVDTGCGANNIFLYYCILWRIITAPARVPWNPILNWFCTPKKHRVSTCLGGTWISLLLSGLGCVSRYTKAEHMALWLEFAVIICGTLDCCSEIPGRSTLS